MRYASLSFGVCALALGGLLISGCEKAPAEQTAAAPPPIKVSHPVEREIVDYAEFTARTAAVDCVEVRAHVWGYLEKANFKEGAHVQKGDVLFELDARPYQAEYARAQATLATAHAHVNRALADYKRAEGLLPKKAIAQSDYDLAKDGYEAAAAAVKVAEAALNIAKLDLDFTKITAPISGRVSRYHVTVGNLVQSGDQANSTLLTTIVSMDPMYAYFDVDERTVPNIRRLVKEAAAVGSGGGSVPVQLGLANEDGFRHRGTIDFVDNQVNPKTGTLRVRATFPNKDETLLPGLFARVRVPVGAPHRAPLITDRAIDNDQGQRIVYVVNDKNEVVTRPIRTGALHGGLREIEAGLKTGERVVVTGLQLVRSGMKVEPEVVEMPRQNGKKD